LINLLKSITLLPMKLELYTDGGARGNPGPGASAFVMFDDEEHLLFSHKKYLGTTTNNIAEYEAIISSLEEAKKRKATDVDLYTDSQLACFQLQGKYKVKQSHLKILFEKVRALESHFDKVNYQHVPREHEKIQMADQLVNDMLDEEEAKCR